MGPDDDPSLLRRNGCKSLLDHEPAVFIPSRTVGMLRQAKCVPEHFCSLGIFLLLKKKVPVKIPGVQPGWCKFDGLLQQLASFCLVAKTDWKTRDAIIEHGEACRRTCIELCGRHVVSLFQDIASALCEAKGRKHTGHRGAFTGDDTVPYQYLGAVRKS